MLIWFVVIYLLKMTAWIPFVGAWITMMLGSIPQQDVFQRITSAKNEIVLAFALNTSASIFKMVKNAYKITLVSAFFPLFLGLYWP